MRIKITMVDGTVWEFKNLIFNSIQEFLKEQVAADYYVIDPKGGIAIRCSNILKIEHLDIEKAPDKVLEDKNGKR